MSAGQTSQTASILIEAIRVAISSLRGIASALETALIRFESVSPAASSSVNPAPVGSEAGDSVWDLITEAHSGPSEVASSGTGNDGYQAVAESITEVPPACIELCSVLGSGGPERAKRAWEAGLWARAAVEDRIPTVRPTPKIELRSTVYIILKAPGLLAPVRVHSSARYFQILPSFKGVKAVSHGFPSIAEAKVYCAAFGIVLPPESK